MPPSATSNLPRRSATAPVNAPRTWPNSSLSISSSGNRGAIDFDECRRPPAAQRVDGARDHLLAGPVFAIDQHAAVGRRRDLDLFAELTHHVAVADHRLRAVDPRPQRTVLGFETPLAQRVVDDENRLVERERLLDEVEGAHFDRAHGRLDVAVARDEDDLRVDLPLAQPRQRREAVHAGQPDVEHDQVDRPSRDPIETRLEPFQEEGAVRQAGQSISHFPVSDIAMRPGHPGGRFVPVSCHHPTNIHPAIGGILWSFEPVWLGDAMGRDAEPST